MSPRPKLKLYAALMAGALALAACTQGAVVAPVVEIIVPPPPPLSSSEPVVAAPDEPEREPPRAKIAGDLHPIIVRIVHTASRQQDAELIQKRLAALGATVHLYPTSDEGNDAHVGRLNIKGAFQKYAPLIVRTVEDIEPQEVHQEDSLEGDHNAVVWVVR
jgi:hypothetical protein